MNKYVSTITKLTENYRSLTNDPINLVEVSLKRAEQHKNLNAFINFNKFLTIKSESVASSNRYKNGKQLAGNLDGIPIAIKDNFCTKDIRTTCASRMLQDFIPTYNATVYERLKICGAILIGKTNLDQFAMGSGTVDSFFGPTKNFWTATNTNNNKNYQTTDNWRIAGGSSGGSAVAVASGICLAAIGSDTGGSTRNPASYCGLMGLKPTYGLVSRHGLIPLVNSMDVPGIFARCADDCATILNAIAGPDPNDSTTLKTPFRHIKLSPTEQLSVRNLRIGIPQEYYCMGMMDDVVETWRKIADLLEDAGAKVSRVSLPHTSASIFVYSILNQCEVASNMARYDGVEFGHRAKETHSTEQLYAKTRAEGFNAVVKNRILAGNFYLLRKNYEKYFEKALRVRRLIQRDFLDVFHSPDERQNIDLILTPTTLTDAPSYDAFIQSDNRDQCAVQDFCTQPANMAGIPAITVPIRLSSNGLPIGLQLMGPNLSEHLLLNVAKWIECQVDFKRFRS